jgi:hypothetical protein
LAIFSRFFNELCAFRAPNTSATAAFPVMPRCPAGFATLFAMAQVLACFDP